jgi:cytoskeleton protein RodZ
MDGIGERLKRRREELGLSLEAAAEATKLRPELIEAIEEGRVGVFSAKVYRLAFIRAYATVLKLDADELIRDQKTEEERAQEALRGIRIGPPRDTRLRKTLIGIGAGVLAAIVIFIVLDRAFQTKRSPVGRAAESAESSKADLPGSGRAAKGAPRMIRVESKEGNQAPGESVVGERGQEEGSVVGVPAVSQGRGSVDTSRAAALPVAPPPSTQAPEGGERPRILEVSAHGGALLTIASGDSILIEGSISGGDRKVFTSRKPFVLVFLSDRNAVSLTLDGRPVSLPASNKRQIYDYALP